MPIKLANNASGTLATAINASDTGIVLTTGDGAEFPALAAGEYFYLTLTAPSGAFEIVKATARAGDAMTVVRAQEGTTALGFPVGSRAELRVTAASVDDRVDEAEAYALGLDTTLRADLAASSGASLVGFLQAGTSAVPRTAQAKLRETVSVKDFGAVGDGVADDTAALQAAIDAASGKTLFINAGTYVTRQLNLVSDLTIAFDPSAVLQASVGYTATECVMRLTSISNVTIHGNHANIVMNKPEYTTGEQRHGVRIVTCSNVTINDLHVSDTGGDGYYIGSVDSASACTNIYLNNCFSDNARRNGLSIVSGDGVYVNGGEYSNTIGTSPEFGIDIEANGSGESLKNINIVGVTTKNNRLGGIQVVLEQNGLTTTNNISINITDCYSYQDGAYGGIRFANGPVNALAGSVNITDCTIENPYSSGMQFIRLTPQMPFISIKNLTVINPAFSRPSPGAIDLSCIDLNGQTSSNSGTVNNVLFENCKFIDNRAVPVMYAGVYAGGTYGCDNITFRNISVVNSTAPGRKIVYAGNCTNVNAVYDVPFVTTFSTPIPSVENYSVGQVISSSSGSTLTLGVASAKQGLQVTFAPAIPTLIQPQAGDTIFFQGLTAGTGLYLENGDSLTLQAASNGWKVVRSNFPLKTGSGSPVGSVTTRFVGRQYFDTVGLNFWVSTGTTTADWKQTT
jgi:hypothetical protein